MITEKRKGEIALALLKYRMRKLGNLAKATGIPQKELKEFGRILFRNFGKKPSVNKGIPKKRKKTRLEFNSLKG